MTKEKQIVPGEQSVSQSEEDVSDLDPMKAQELSLDIVGKDIERDAEKFWDEAISEQHLTKTENGDTLTYEEAKEQGLLDELSNEESLGGSSK